MMDSRNVKLWFCVACLASTMGAPAPSSRPQLYLDIIDMAAISRMTPQQLEKLAEGLAAEEIMRTKRSSAQALSSVVSKASSGLQSKVGLLGQASAFISSASSKNSGGDEHHGYSYEPHDEKYDYWGLKKSILYTLFQAVKAITGGVTILKGQLIKGGGALASTLGKVIAVKGDAVSNLGKKIVNSAALSNKKPHAAPVYGPPPPTTHIEYGAPSAYGAPTAPAHYSHTAPSIPTGYAAHKYPATLDGRGKLNGVHAGLVILTPLGDTAPRETLEAASTGHVPLEPPPSILNTVFSAIKNVFPTATSPVDQDHPEHIEEPYAHQPPPPHREVPVFKPMTWGAVNSYGEPASADAYPDYDPRNPHPPFDYATSKHSVVPTKHYKTGLTPDKIQKINFNLKKLNHYMNNQQRSSEELPRFNGLGGVLNAPLFPTPVVSDNELGVLPGELLPDPTMTTISTSSTTSTKTTSTTSPSTTTTELPKTDTKSNDVKFFLRGNKIVQV